MRILMADDDTTFRLIMGGKIQKLGHEFVAVEDGALAWKAFQNEYFPVLITDLMMPRMDGIVLTSLVRTRPYSQYTYVIMLTTWGGKHNYQDAMNAGVDDFLTKPPDEDELAARLMVAQRIVGIRNHVRRLETIMAVCSYCKKIRSPDNQWVSFEEYADKQLHAKPSHTFCPTCFAVHVQPEMEALQRARRE